MTAFLSCLHGSCRPPVWYFRFIAVLIAGTTVGVQALAADGQQETPPPPMQFAVGDKLSVQFFEPLAADRFATLGTTKGIGPTYYLHTELSGTFPVASDWTVALPMIGDVVVAHHTAAQVQAELAADFVKLTGHQGYVTITIAERLPVYVVGAIKSPGAYKFVAGLRPLDMVALAGGALRPEEDRWATVEALRQAGNNQAAETRLKHALAEIAMLKSELDGTPPKPPDQLVQLVGSEEAAKLMTAEEAGQQPIISTRADNEAQLRVEVAMAQRAIDLDTSRLPVLEADVEVQRKHVGGLGTMMAARTIDNITMAQARTDMIASQDRLASVQSAIIQDQKNFAGSKFELAKFEAQTKTEIEQQIASAQHEIDALAPATQAGSDIIHLLAPQNPRSELDSIHFSIVRGSQVLPAGVTTLLLPGDLLRVDSEHPATERSDNSVGRNIFQSGDNND